MSDTLKPIRQTSLAQLDCRPLRDCIRSTSRCSCGAEIRLVIISWRSIFRALVIDSVPMLGSATISNYKLGISLRRMVGLPA